MAHTAAEDILEHSELKRSITAKQLYFYVVGDVLGSGIYVLVGLVAAAVGGAFWMSFLAGVAIAIITGLAYAELVTKYPQAAGASLYINKAFRKPILTFFITICMLSANMAAVGSLASGFVRYFAGVIGLSEDAVVATLIIALVFIMIITTINLIGISESVVVNVIMTFIELFGLALIMLIGIIALVTGIGDPAVLTQFSVEGGGGAKVLALLSGVSLAFFAMTGFENAANVAEETIDPAQGIPAGLDRRHAHRRRGLRACVHLRGPGHPDRDPVRAHTLLEVVRAGILPIPVASDAGGLRR